jgi:hypothetical protein
MGLLSGLLGNASAASVDDIVREFGKLLAPEETVERAYKLVRDVFIFTNKRLILVDKQGLTGRKIEYHSVPYKSITHFSIETAGSFDLDAELKIHISGGGFMQKTFSRQVDIYEVQTVLALMVMR